MRGGFDLACNGLPQLDRESLLVLVVFQDKRRHHAGDHFKISAIDGYGRGWFSSLGKTGNAKAQPKNGQAKSYTF